MLTIIPDPTTPAPPRLLSVLIAEAPELRDWAADLTGTTVRVNPGVPEAEQLAAILDAVTFLWTGRATFGHANRHLKVVPA